MEELLYLVHRIPYPPNKGDKIRSYHLLKHLAKRYCVHVGAFVDDPEDWQYAGTLAQIASGEVKLLPLKPRWATVRSLTGFLSGEPLTMPYYRDAHMQQWVDKLLTRQPVRHAVVFSSSMAQYLERQTQIRRVIDFVDIDSDKWRQYADKKPWPLSWVYRREARTLLAQERRIAGEFDASTFVSEAEAALFRQMAPESANKISGYSNGVDTEYFSPEASLSTPYAEGEAAVVFTGAMDYWANVEAVTWFAQEVWPLVRRQHAQAKFYIVGSRPTPEVQALARQEGIVVTGRVEDTRPYIKHAGVAVAPLRIARGIQNKVLEAMAMAKPTVVTAQALEGIDAEAGKEILLAHEAVTFAQYIIDALQGRYTAMGEAARQCVLRGFSWDGHLQLVDQLLENPQPSHMAEVLPCVA